MIPHPMIVKIWILYIIKANIFTKCTSVLTLCHNKIIGKLDGISYLLTKSSIIRPDDSHQ